MNTTNAALLVPLLVGIGLCLIGTVLTLAAYRRPSSPQPSQPRSRLLPPISLPERQQMISCSPLLTRQLLPSSAMWSRRAAPHHSCPACGKEEKDARAHFCGFCGQPLVSVSREH